MRLKRRLIIPLLCAVVVIGLVVWIVLTPSDKDLSQDGSVTPSGTSSSTDSLNDVDRSLVEDVAAELFEAVLAGTEPRSEEPACDPEVPGRDVTAFSVCSASGRLISTDHSSLGAQASWQLDTDLVSAARAVLEQYRDSGDVTLTYDGYIDLFRNVWGCVVSARSGWVEIVVVSDRAGEAEDTLEAEAPSDDEGICTVTVVRLGIGTGHESTRFEADEAA